MAPLKTMKFDCTLVLFLPMNSYRDIRQMVNLTGLTNKYC